MKEFADRLESLAADRVAPRLYSRRLPLSIEVHQTPDPLPIAALLNAHADGDGAGDPGFTEQVAFSPVQTGWRWGPVWSSAWFRLRASLPADATAVNWSLRFSCGTEATVWRRADASPRHGLDVNHTVMELRSLDDWRPAAKPNGTHDQHGTRQIEILIEGACNRPLGASTFFWDDPAEVARWKEELPGRLDYAELVVVNDAAWRLHVGLKFAAAFFKLYEPPASPSSFNLPPWPPLAPAVAADVGAQLATIERALADEHPDFDDAADRLLSLLSSIPRQPETGASPPSFPPSRLPSRSTCRPIGHAHIDTAWLWTLRETRRKCLRTFATALGIMERDPGFTFLCSQAQQYAWVEQDSPPLFERIREMVHAGRWEPGGAMWIEPDCNLPSGESFIRQVIHGRRYWSAAFGDAGRQSYLYLPDTFGFPASLPQIIAGCGLSAFVFNKLWWNDTTRPPSSFFRWRGIDGTEVVSFLTPGMEYNATFAPAELRRGETNHREKDPTSPREWVQPFGYGDGGGGPTLEMIETMSWAEATPSMPHMAFTRVDEFCERLHESRARLQARGSDIPVWPEPELYLERHRGTLTTQAWIKKANREAEELLRTTELLAFAGPRRVDGAAASALSQRLDEAWKLALLNQFHDILPGSSIGPVYDDTKAQYVELRKLATDALPSLTALGWIAGNSPLVASSTVAVLNPASTARSGVVQVGDSLRYVENVPAMGVRASDGEAEPTKVVKTRARRLDNGAVELSNGLVRVTVRPDGTLADLGADHGTEGGRASAFTGDLNRLVMFDDNPKYWEAWDIDKDYVDHPVPLAAVDSFDIVDETSTGGQGAVGGEEERGAGGGGGRLRVSVRCSRPLGERSRIVQTISLDAGAVRVDVRSNVEWRENRKRLRVEFPTGVAAPTATCGIQFGHVERPTTRETPRDAARFEFCAHRWMNLSENGRGFALLNDCKYGHSCEGGTMGLTLLRSPKFPDPEADMGSHEFVYSVMPHGGDWRAAGVDREGEALNRPMVVLGAGEPGRSFTPIEVRTEGEAGVEIAAIKPAEEGNALVVRLVETRGRAGRGTVRWNVGVTGVRATNLIEEAADLPGFIHAERGGVHETSFEVRPFGIVTLAADRV